ncbi:MAG: hypothetical protein Q4C98_08870 [Capnocytophaga sp.]|nr:hypothetical protein [Capnocytophaga sp.]
MKNEEIIQLTQELIHRGTQFDLDFLENIYDENLIFIFVDSQNQIKTLNKEDNMNFFRNLKGKNAEPLNTYAEFHYADSDGENGFVILSRKMQLSENEQDFLFNIYWKKQENQWKIVREVVYIK